MSAETNSRRQNQKRERGAPLISPARIAAFEMLRRVEEEGAFASVLLAASDDEMRAEDRALRHELVLGVLRWQFWLDQLIEHYAGRSAGSLDAPVRRALRLGLYQLRFLSRIPASAIVNESVNLAHRARLRSAAGLINAVLRRATREPNYDPASGITDPFEKVAVETSHPVWLIERWVDAFGIEETKAFARSNNEAPPNAFRVVAERAGSDQVISQLRAAGGNVMPSKIAPGAWRIEGAGAVLRKLAREGRIYIQDEASQLVSHALGAQPGERVLDVCAAPGSKTTYITDRIGGKGLIVAGDIHGHRLQTVREACARQGIGPIHMVAYDATAPLPFTDQTFDRVLVDAPCTGTGTLRRNPEIRWRIEAADIKDLSARQQQILANASKMVRPGGRLLYSTCSVEPEENEAVIAAFLQRNNDFTQIVTPAPASLQVACGAARTWPHRDGADGFYVAALERGS
ncbi:MAG TPA: 16S rRNA (cytosine(967)-C(5))-methyltransferase RsmB [Pyrinomonadaceae bacterium]|nr:16S rRNA (cytosine(967)-C(5))-methyltransferase RsmB [Pyrinomonadaceae bacterium]